MIRPKEIVMPTVVRIEVPAGADPLVIKAAELFEQRITPRTGVPVIRSGKADVVVTLSIDPTIGTEGYRISDGDSLTHVRVAGNEPRGVLYGVGKLLREAHFGPGLWQIGSYRGTSVPRRQVRGMYFASHFFNFYHVAPLAEVERYVEDLALWGCNVLNVWFDMHHYKSINEPVAQQMIARLKSILHAGNRVGMGAGLTTLANEAYADSPEHLRAVPTQYHYKVELCPSKPEGLALTLKWREEVLRAFSDVKFDALWIWPHDQGGCLCEQCAPWGANGFLRVAEPVAKMAKQILPGAKIIVSTWCFDVFQKGEWSGFADKINATKPDWIDYIMADAHGDFPRFVLEHGVPGGYPMINFPEISMFKQGPWGGYGAMPAADRFQKIWDTVGHRLEGGFPYSETISEDMNKIINLMHYWSDQSALESIRQYAGYEFGHDVATDVVQLSLRLEAQLDHQFNWDREQKEFAASKTDPSVKDRLSDGRWYYLGTAEKLGVEHARQTLELMKRIESRLNEHDKKSWRWRILVLRTTLDYELVSSGGVPSPLTEACFEELVTILHAGPAERCVQPPAVKRALKGFGSVNWKW